jgi:predicted phosphate transport protein (TIGR00153 family)
MRSIASVFGRSPFVPLQSHMDKVAACVSHLPDIMAAYDAGDETRVGELCKVISTTEYEADQVKHDIRNSLPRGLFMPVDRTNLLRILTIQDSIANCAENVAVLLTFKIAKRMDPFKAKFDKFTAKNLAAFQKVREVMDSLDELLESGFGGSEATKVRTMVDEVALLEYHSDVMQRDLLRELLMHEDELSKGDFFLWARIVREWSELSDRSEELANVVRMTLESK